jgi:hypothetical protein
MKDFRFWRRQVARWRFAGGSAAAAICLMTSARAASADLRVGIANHAFDHLGGIGDQADAAARSGATTLYVTGLGGFGYSGLPEQTEFAAQKQATAAYLRQARTNGVRLAIGYICATSIVRLGQFDRHWPDELRRQFHSAPREWRQQDRNGKVLLSWYGGDYEAACMNNPDWGAYERFVARQQIEAGCDGIFFDNPTVHPEGCYCRWCMDKFDEFIKTEGGVHDFAPLNGTGRLEALRDFALRNRDLFLRFRCTIARDFLAEMRGYARTLKPDALITANNSLNSAGVLYSQCRSYGYNIYEMSKAEDFVVVEDMSSQPRALANGQVLEYGPTYQQLQAISHGKPVVAVTLAEADYHTAPNLVRLAMAEAAANGSSYLSWPTWPEQQRERMISSIRPEADFLKRNAELLNSAVSRRDVTLFLPFRKWLETGDCVPSRLATELSRANVQYGVICEDDLTAFMRQKQEPGTAQRLKRARELLMESPAALLPQERALGDVFIANGGILVIANKTNWLTQVQEANGGPSLRLWGPATLRARVFDETNRTIVHLLNLNVARISSFEDKVIAATDVRITVQVPFNKIRAVRALTADAEGSSGALEFSKDQKNGTWVEVQVPRVELSTVIAIE